MDRFPFLVHHTYLINIVGRNYRVNNLITRLGSYSALERERGWGYFADMSQMSDGNQLFYCGMTPHPTEISPNDFYAVATFFAPKIAYAIVCGSIIGLEREIRNKTAGIKTNILICLGAALYSSASVLISNSFSGTGYFGDPGRVAAQIVSGIGFLGGGAIIQSRGTVLGLTTAATIWVVAAIGILVGTGFGEVGLFASIGVVMILTFTRIFERRYLGRQNIYNCEVTVDDPGGKTKQIIDSALESNDLTLEDFDIATKAKKSIIHLKYRGHRENHRLFLLELWKASGVLEVKQK